MVRVFWALLGRICLRLLSLRYRIRIVGLEKLNRPEFDKGQILFLPNHPAHMDPLFLYLLLWPRFRMRPLVVEHIYRVPLLKPLVRIVKALVVPNFDTSVNQLKIKRAHQVIQEIAKGLKRGENFLLHPAGRLKASGKEILGGASAAHELVQEYPEAHIVMVRATGLWGSSFSRALSGRTPDLSAVLWHGIKVLFKNLIFFCPRRKVVIEFEVDPPDLPRKKTRLDFNRYLEHWYNRYPDEQGKIREEEPLKLVSYSFWRKKFPEVYLPKKKKFTNEISVSDETRTKIYREIRRILDNPEMKISPEKSLTIDLGMDSLNIAEMISYLVQNYDVQEVYPEEIDTVQQVLEIAEGAAHSDGEPRERGHEHWPKETGRPGLVAPIGGTLPEALLNLCERMGSFAACGDDLVGVMSYKQFKRAILVLACHFQKFPDSRIAVMLPASIGAFIVISALQCARKVPVMLNWTLGPRYLEEMMNLSGAKRVLTSWKFLDRLSHVEFGSLVDQIEFLEDIRQGLSLWTKLKGAFLSLCSVQTIVRTLRLDQVSEEDFAAILFTSGTEASPKGVPISHKNILSNIRAGLQCIEMNAKDVFYSVAPPFHVFGFTITGFFALLVGLKVAFYPDPTDGVAIAEGIERWGITFFGNPPSFLKRLLQTARKGQLKTVRVFFVSAEKTPPELDKQIDQLGTGACLIEGYGITECSGGLAITHPPLPSKGVGIPIPEVEICIIHPESGALLPSTSEGEICARGPNVFQGYLGNSSDPFIEIEGQKWYRTGDLGFFDSEGNLYISGRFKRFTKMGGEMISLGAIEETLTQELLHRGTISPDLCSLAVCAQEKEPGKPQLILFTTIPLEKEQVNEILRNSGFSRLIKISSVRHIEEIPLMGTGKTDYRRLQAMIV